ncbi:hypothetical protein [Stutzerimonas stutzeri]|uniref:hypothetical protein n=1 Tax=Stutzerimonas stutzeri TaxID=316 RepID=UPI002108DF19|nr:hypothetical protein [Stutzerimonas stutzeri]MCQ4242082.1 hypothetical protein [Stutzerimonas stutzeri]
MSTPRWVLIPKAAEMLGYSRVVIEQKIKNGTWSEGRIWRKARDGRIFISLEKVACKQLLAMAPCTEPQTITVQLNRHESIHETVTPLISPSRRHAEKRSTCGSSQRHGTRSGPTSSAAPRSARAVHTRPATPTPAGAW